MNGTGEYIMKLDGAIESPEESFAFIRSLTFIGGFLNAYSYFTRGGAFVTFHTGNLVRVGLSIVEKDINVFWNSFIPITAAFLGVIIASLLRHRTIEEAGFQRKVILTEIISLFIIGFIWTGSQNNGVNFVLSMIGMFQLSCFRKIKGTVHNTTIMTGNLRTLAQYFSDMLISRDRKSALEFLAYLLNFLSFVFGVVAGGILSLLVGNYAIWLCVLILLIFFIRFKE